MKIIFLDIDGVLNHSLMWKNKDTDSIKTEEGWLSKTSIKLLNELTDETKAKIVISSTWRLLPNKDKLFSVLKDAGITGDIIDITPKHLGVSTLRGNEIWHWIRTNTKLLGEDIYSDFDQYVILDDDSDMLLWQANNYLSIDRYCGLTPTDIYKAKRILS